MENDKINFTTINCDGKEVKWSWTPKELVDNYLESTDIPMLDDEVVYCEFAGRELHFDTFNDLAVAFSLLGTID